MNKTQHIPTYKKVAKRLGLSVKELKKGGDFSKALYIRGNGRILLLAPRETGFYPDTHRWFTVLANSKILSQQVLKDLGYNIIASRYFDTDQTTRTQLITDLKKVSQFPVVVKPEVGNKGRGIVIATNTRELLGYGKELFSQKRHFMVQKLTFGTEYRVLMINKKVYVVHAKEFPHVTGDGTHSLDQLLKPIANETINNQFLTLYLEENDLTRDSVIEHNKKIPYNFTRKGSFSYYESTRIPQSVAKWAIQLGEQLCSTTIGIDVFIPDDFTDHAQYKIIEINASPGFGYLRDRYKDAALVEQICEDVLRAHFHLS